MEFHPDDRVYIKPMDRDASGRYTFGGDYSGVVDVAMDGSLCTLYIDGGGWGWHPDELERQLPIGTDVLVASDDFPSYMRDTPNQIGTIVDVEDANQHGPFGFWYTVALDGLAIPVRIASSAVVPIDQDDSVTTDPGDADGDPVAAEDLEPILFS